MTYLKKSNTMTNNELIDISPVDIIKREDSSSLCRLVSCRLIFITNSFCISSSSLTSDTCTICCAKSEQNL